MSRGRGGSEQGSVAITVALCMTVLLGLAALVVDVGLNWAARTSAQTAADAAALAGASSLLVDGPAAAVVEVETLLAQNIDGLVMAPGWATDGIESNGEVDCWTLPGDPPAPLAACLDGSNALRVITPPINVQYAFAPVLGKATNSIKALAAAGVGPTAPNNCVLCLLDTGGANRLAAIGPGAITADGGGIVVNSDSPTALVSVGGDIVADQIRVVGGFDDGPGGGILDPTPQAGGPPAIDPLEYLLTPDQLLSPPIVRETTARTIDTDETLLPGIYAGITVTAGATVTLDEGIYVFRDTAGLTIQNDATVVSSGDGVTIYLACSGYPAPCSGLGARFRVENNGRFLATPATSGDYAGLSIFADRGNTRPLRHRSTRDLNLAGALYGASMPVRIQSTGDLRVDSLMAVGSLATTLLSTGSVGVSYDPATDILGLGRPVLIR
ncbi:MAG TPA: pilus assembly protein TadG-related protein [Actinomycetota bacterium]|nr:pilus assembly protein TadG-related protein [Actinomycetota bacterium]